MLGVRTADGDVLVEDGEEDDDDDDDDDDEEKREEEGLMLSRSGRKQM